MTQAETDTEREVEEKIRELISENGPDVADNYLGVMYRSQCIGAMAFVRLYRLVQHHRAVATQEIMR
jgi:hypothetical protein